MFRSWEVEEQGTQLSQICEQQQGAGRTRGQGSGLMALRKLLHVPWDHCGFCDGHIPVGPSHSQIPGACWHWVLSPAPANAEGPGITTVAVGTQVVLLPLWCSPRTILAPVRATSLVMRKMEVVFSPGLRAA